MDGCLVSCNSVVETSDAKDEDEEDDSKASGVTTETSEVAVVSAGRKVRTGMYYDTCEE
ncbi:hypothetical protein PF005_g6797 [Phytophthora fragariae]|uniref:Uncharacterized protein n=1 Tax=Phytophthora fragariae TaxID=53985 RepID=A0A6A3RU24_9STRA|nr:hypothetical protein PF006_g22146 [Phytophthora fragariae]KAE9124607.1 hypothetical protein PF007_g6657 [Phytophthora fragariae]KAE9222193.1 hypothetical protein PF005_g6797 [Phytophthora fragariae]KAE9285306.1 hypothetical protein PF008_g26948 [Phytophthora fragariae]